MVDKLHSSLSGSRSRNASSAKDGAKSVSLSAPHRISPDLQVGEPHDVVGGGNNLGMSNEEDILNALLLLHNSGHKVLPFPRCGVNCDKAKQWKISRPKFEFASRRDAWVVPE